MTRSRTRDAGRPAKAPASRRRRRAARHERADASRLSAVDTAWLRMDRPGNLMMIYAICARLATGWAARWRAA